MYVTLLKHALVITAAIALVNYVNNASGQKISTLLAA